MVVLFRCGWKQSDEYEWENNVSDSPTLLRSEDRDVTTLQGRGVKARDSHHFKVNMSMCVLFSIFFDQEVFKTKKRFEGVGLKLMTWTTDFSVVLLGLSRC